MKQNKLQYFFYTLISIFIFTTSSEAQNVFPNNIIVEGGNVFLSDRLTQGPRVYGGGVTWTGIKDQSNKWAFLTKNNSYSSMRINSAKINLFTSGRVDFLGTPVGLTYTAIDLGADFHYEEDPENKSLENNKAANYYTALIPQYANRFMVGTYDKYLYGTYTKNIWRTWERSLSDKRVKDNIKGLEGSLDKILSLKGYSYRFNENHPFITQEDINRDKTNLGFLAQDLQKIVPEMVVQDESTGYLMVENYEQLFPVIVEAMKEQQTQIEEKEELITDLISRLDKLEEVAAATQQILEDFSLEVTLSGSAEAILAQNHPNPFNATTNINFFVPHSSDAARIQIFDQNGRLWKSIDISDRGHGNLKIHTSEIPSGTFVYNLEVNGRIVSTKKMVIAE